MHEHGTINKEMTKKGRTMGRAMGSIQTKAEEKKKKEGQMKKRQLITLIRKTKSKDKIEDKDTPSEKQKNHAR